MRLLAFCAAALGLTCARALTVPEVFEKIEQKLPTREAPPPKYFLESEASAHYDDKYFQEVLEPEDQYAGIRVLMQTYLATFRDLGIQTWLMHGSLLGWWWGKKVMPWDLDADVSVTETDMYYLAAYYNMTIYYFQYEGCPNGSFFQLDINPAFKYRGRDDGNNFIDARWVDMQTGLFIDITAARYDPGHEMGDGVMYDKHDHEFKDKYIFPLLDTTFEGVSAKVPYRTSFPPAMATGMFEPILNYKLSIKSLILNTGQQRRGGRLEERLRGAQRTNIQDDSFNIDIAGLNIASSTPAAPTPAPPVSSANTSAKRRRLDNEPPPSVQAPESVRRRSPRSRPEDPYDLPDSSKESGAQDATAEPTEVEEPVLDDLEEVESDPGSDVEPQPEPEPEPELPSPGQSVEASEDNEAENELPVLPNTDASKSPDVRPSSRTAQQNTEGLPDGAQSVRMSEAVSSTTRLHTTLQDDDMPASSSPLVRKVRRSEGPTTIRSRMSYMRTPGTPEPAEDVDELSPDRPDHAPADDELSEPNTVEEAEPEVEPIDEEPEEEVEDAQEEEAVAAEAIDAVEAAKAIGRKRPRRSLPSQSPAAGPEEQADDEEPSPKRRRGRPSRSPATQKQPATKPKANTTAKPQTTGPKPLPKQVRRTKQAAKERRISDGTAIELTVHRFVNVKKFIKDDGNPDQLAADVPFIPSSETVVDVFSQVCLEVIEGTVAKLLETLGTTEDKEKKKECRIKIRALEAYKEELNSRLLQLAIHLSDWQTLRKRVRVIQREKLSLREEILRLKAEREQVALKVDAVRIKHEEDTKESKYRLDTSAIMHDIDMAVERGRDAPELSRAQEKKADLANLELLVARITDEASSASSAGGMLQQVRNFNAFLERAAIALETR
ncbi:hypothetical protein FAVG1_11720 [Fusarium avenaceum]|nr:hypothetical protein FAVG1_11720 [Fusarium avenaceum]